MTRLLQWFLDLVQIDTQSQYPPEVHPSNPGETLALSFIKESLSGISGISMDEFDHGTLVFTLEATEGMEQSPVIAFASHVDTATGISGQVKPIIHHYTDGDIILPENGVSIKSDSPSLIKLRENGGGHVITSDGSSLLGADDKAGVAVLMELICRIEEKELPHSKLLFFFTTDEEIGEFACDIPFDIFSGIHILWTVDGTTLGTINTGSLKIIRNIFTFTANPVPLTGNIQVLIDFKGKTGHVGLDPLHIYPANSAAFDFLSTLMENDSSCRAVYLTGNLSSTSLIFAYDGRKDYKQCLEAVLIRHKGIEYVIEEYPLGTGQFSNPALKFAADLGKSVSGPGCIKNFSGDLTYKGFISSYMVQYSGGNRKSCLIPIELKGETDEDLEILEHGFLEIEKKIRRSLPENVVMEKERQFICENIAFSINENRGLLENMSRAMEKNKVQVIEQFVAGSTDGGMINLQHKELPCPNLGTGAEKIHSFEEHISVEDLEKLADILTSYIESYV